MAWPLFFIAFVPDSGGLEHNFAPLKFHLFPFRKHYCLIVLQVQMEFSGFTGQMCPAKGDA